MDDISAHLDRFYSLLSRLERLNGQGLPLSSYSGKSPLPERGVYFFLEPGEFRSSAPHMQRVVRVGTHALTAGSKSTLWKRLKAHFGTRSGIGNHRGSIFRLHVGAALLAREGKYISSWGLGSSAPLAVRQSEALKAAEDALEQEVSRHIGAMSVLWVDVPDTPGPKSNRGLIERNAIGLLSNHLCPIDKASEGWLGRYSHREDIQSSHLWNLNHVREPYSPLFLDTLEDAVRETEMTRISTSRYSEPTAAT